jgi:hypothetical protein
MTKFRATPVIVAGERKWEVERRRGLFWVFETFAADEYSAKVAIEHLGGPILKVTTSGKKR